MKPDSPSAARFEYLVTEFNDAEGVTPPRGGGGFETGLQRNYLNGDKISLAG